MILFHIKHINYIKLKKEICAKMQKKIHNSIHFLKNVILKLIHSPTLINLKVDLENLGL